MAFDAVVVGSGIGGLSAAALLSTGCFRWSRTARARLSSALCARRGWREARRRGVPGLMGRRCGSVRCGVEGRSVRLVEGREQGGGGRGLCDAAGARGVRGPRRAWWCVATKRESNPKGRPRVRAALLNWTVSSSLMQSREGPDIKFDDDRISGLGARPVTEFGPDTGYLTEHWWLPDI